MIREFELGLKRPIVGHGVGTTPEVKFHNTGKRKASHNMYGEILIEIGIIGFIFFFRYILSIWKTIKKTPAQPVEILDKYKNINKTIVTVTIMYCVYSINYYGLSQYYWYLLGGLAVAVSRLQNKELLNNHTPYKEL